MMRYSGTLGNTIFFVCSAWFLLDSKDVNKKKIFQMIIDIWTVSFLILIIVLIIRHGQLNGSLILRSLLPNTFGNNWYLSCYMIFYAIHPALNKIINGFNQLKMLRATSIMIVLYLIISFITLYTGQLYDAENHFFSSTLIVWIVIYFIIGYQKMYLKEASDNKIINVCLIILGIIGNYGLIIFTNYFDIKTGLLDHALQLWDVSYNPFLIILVIGMFNLAKSITFVNKPINCIAKFSLYIYIIHENLLLRTLYRPAMWNYVYTHYGYDHILRWIGFLVFVIFVFALLSSMVYQVSFHKLTIKICNRLYPKLSQIAVSFENRIMKIH